MKTHILSQSTRTTRLAAAVMCVLMFCAPAVLAQSGRLRLSQLDKLAAKAVKVSTVNLAGPVLESAQGRFMQFQATNAAGGAGMMMMQHWSGIYVKSFQFSKPGEYSRADLESVLKQLRAGGWTPMVSSEDKRTGKVSDVYIMEKGGKTTGMAVIDAEPTKLDIVNLVGPVNLGQLSAASSQAENKKSGRQPTPPRQK